MSWFTDCAHAAKNKSLVNITMGEYGVFECALCKRCGALEPIRRLEDEI